MRAYLRELVRYREVLYVFVWRDIKIRYKQSVMGILWAVFMPIVIVAAGVVVKLAFAHISGRAMETQEIATVSVKAVAWAFFVSALRFGTNSLIGNSNLVTKIYFPKMTFPMSAVLSSLFDFAISCAALTVILAFVGVGFGLNLLWVPVLVVVLVVFTFGLTGPLAVANLFFRDVKYLVEIIVTFAIFFTPVFYEASLFGKWERVIMLNPMAPILEGFRAAVVLNQAPAVGWLAYSGAIGAALTFLAVYAFARLEPRFAESI
jgi:ABC-type polysaccharide/polyol phosphate export permease